MISRLELRTHVAWGMQKKNRVPFIPKGFTGRELRAKNKYYFSPAVHDSVNKIEIRYDMYIKLLRPYFFNVINYCNHFFTYLIYTCHISFMRKLFYTSE